MEVKITNDEQRRPPTRPMNDQGQCGNSLSKITTIPRLALTSDHFTASTLLPPARRAAKNPNPPSTRVPTPSAAKIPTRRFPVTSTTTRNGRWWRRPTPWVCASGIRAGLAQRARIVLLAGDGHSNTEIAARVGVSRPTLIHWPTAPEQPIATATACLWHLSWTRSLGCRSGGRLRCGRRPTRAAEQAVLVGGEHREPAAAHPELRVDRPDVAFDGVDRQGEVDRDLIEREQ
jgi:Homeodomain-like domain